MSESERRKAANEALFREVNERIERLHEHFAAHAEEAFEVVCECHHLDCTERIEMMVGDYERVRADSATFFVKAGHEDPTAEDVVDSSGDYLIVRKLPGDPARIARETDPRR
jgi:hypothetical protein